MVEKLNSPSGKLQQGAILPVHGRYIDVKRKRRGDNLVPFSLRGFRICILLQKPMLATHLFLLFIRSSPLDQSMFKRSAPLIMFPAVNGPSGHVKRQEIRRGREQRRGCHWWKQIFCPWLVPPGNTDEPDVGSYQRWAKPHWDEQSNLVYVDTTTVCVVMSS